MDYFKKLEKKNNIIMILVLIVGAILFIASDLLKGMITILTIAYFLLILLGIIYLIKEIKKK